MLLVVCTRPSITQRQQSPAWWTVSRQVRTPCVSDHTFVHQFAQFDRATAIGVHAPVGMPLEDPTPTLLPSRCHFAVLGRTRLCELWTHLRAHSALDNRAQALRQTRRSGSPPTPFVPLHQCVPSSQAIWLHQCTSFCLCGERTETSMRYAPSHGTDGSISPGVLLSPYQLAAPHAAADILWRSDWVLCTHSNTISFIFPQV